MARRRGNNHGANIATTIMCVILICALAALMVSSGTWGSIARAIPGLNQTGTGIEAIKPQGSDHDKLGLTLPSPPAATPDGTGDGTPGDTGQPDTHTEQTPQTRQPSPQGLPANAASPMSITDALAAAQATKTATPHTTGYKAQ